MNEQDDISEFELQIQEDARIELDINKRMSCARFLIDRFGPMINMGEADAEVTRPILNEQEIAVYKTALTVMVHMMTGEDTE